MIYRIIILLIFTLASCNTQKISIGSKLEILDKSHKLILEDNNIKVDSSSKKFILVRLSREQSLNLKAITSSRIGEEVYVKLDGVIIDRLEILSTIDSGLISLNKKSEN